MNMNSMKLCLVIVLIFWLISEFAPADISAVTSMVGIGVAVVAVIMFNRHQNSDKKTDGDNDEDEDDELIEDK
ncbi:hypothetical protein [uncultured Anaerovibrio sp.]|uniref:hypothetical protein n=1 Tax=uncultured Anaerovibrio sp. TaxID=361586 RepID=UPI0025E0248C|nr:hypothetical protein [uncultured Anaerovibrio sp.]